MHALLPKHTRLNDSEAEKLLSSLNISKSQLPKILSSDAGLPEECVVGDVIKIEREEEGEVEIFFRVVV